jgi:hypothetical protein
MNTDQKTCVQIALRFTSWRACFLPAGFITPRELTMDDEAAFALIAVMAACGLFLMMLRVL